MDQIEKTDHGLGLNWGDRRGLNPRPQESQSRALPTELRPPRVMNLNKGYNVARAI
jgi:hypothetical protein